MHACDVHTHEGPRVRHDKCHNVMDRGVRVHIPGCMGCAAFGHHGCTCRDAAPSIGERVLRLERRVARLEKLVRQLVAKKGGYTALAAKLRTGTK